MKKKIVKVYFTIKGYFVSKFRLRSGGKYKALSLEPRNGYNVDYYYRGNRTFCCITDALVNGTGVQYSDTKIKKYKYWEIGVLNFK